MKGIYASSSVNVHYIRVSIERDSTVALAKKLSSSIVARIHLLQPIKTRIFVAANRSFSLSRNKHCTKKNIGNCSVEEAKKMKCYKRLIYKHFVQTSGLSGQQFLSYLPKRFTHLCRAFMETPYWWTETVHQYGRWKSTKTSGVHFFHKSSFSSLES